MKRIDYLREMPVEEIAKGIRDVANLELDDYCKSDCKWSNSLEYHPDEKDCLECCIEWLNGETEENHD